MLVPTLNTRVNWEIVKCSCQLGKHQMLVPRVGIFEIGPLRAELGDVESDPVFGLANLGQGHSLLFLLREPVCSVLCLVAILHRIRLYSNLVATANQTLLALEMKMKKAAC